MLIRDLKIQVLGQSAISLALVGGSLVFWLRPLPDLSIRPLLHWQSNADKVAEVPSGSPPISLNNALERPIFRTSRRSFDPSKIILAAPAFPPVSEQPIVIAPMPQQVAHDTSQFSLKGISINSTQKRVLISSADIPDGKWLKVGDIISDWKIATISKNSVHLTFQGQEAVLSLYVDNLAKPVGSP
jgi:hypothetical protein